MGLYLFKLVCVPQAQAQQAQKKKSADNVRPVVPDEALIPSWAADGSIAAYNEEDEDEKMDQGVCYKKK